LVGASFGLRIISQVQVIFNEKQGVGATEPSDNVAGAVAMTVGHYPNHIRKF
jgi:hypothetical protein